MNNSPVTLRGNLVADPEVKPVGNSTNATFRIAVEHRFQKDGEWESTTSFLQVVCWRWVAEDVARVLEKGSKVVVTGRLTQRSYETTEGDKRYVVEVVADDVALSLGGVDSYQKRTASSSGRASSGASRSSGQGELPDPWDD